MRGLAGSGPGQVVGAGWRKWALMGGIVLVFSVLDGGLVGVVAGSWLGLGWVLVGSWSGLGRVLVGGGVVSRLWLVGFS